MQNGNSKDNISKEKLTRDSLLNMNGELIEKLQKRISVARFKVQEGDNIRLAYMRVYLQALQVQNSILKDLELDEMKKRIEALEAAQDLNEKSVYSLVGGIE